MRPTNRILDDMRTCGMKVEPRDTAFVVGYEIGVMNQQLFYSQVRGPEYSGLHLDMMKTEAADAIMQLRILIESLGMDFQQMIEMGETKVYDRMKDFVDDAKPRPDGTVWEEPERARMIGRINAVLQPTIPFSYKRGGD